MVLIASWLIGAYSPHVRSLLNDEGVRWGVSHIMSNFMRLPLAAILLIMVTVSVVWESGWLSWVFPKNHPLMLKQLRAYTYTNILLLFFFAFFVFILSLPGSPLLSALGEFENSPLSQGWLTLLALLLILLSNVYGFLSGHLVTSADFAFAHTRVLRNFSPAFITLFAVAQVCGCLDYSNLLFFLGPETEKAIMFLLIVLCFVR